MSPVPIYLITATHPKLRSRCWGWYPTAQGAEMAVQYDRFGMDEAGYYSWLAIERVAPGVPATAEVVQWFKLRETGGWEQSSRAPDWAAGTVNWGIG